jgi:hypothetical protein
MRCPARVKSCLRTACASSYHAATPGPKLPARISRLAAARVWPVRQPSAAVRSRSPGARRSLQAAPAAARLPNRVADHGEHRLTGGSTRPAPLRQETEASATESRELTSCPRATQLGGSGRAAEPIRGAGRGTDWPPRREVQTGRGPQRRVWQTASRGEPVPARPRFATPTQGLARMAGANRREMLALDPLCLRHCTLAERRP